jgi:hypothetical protein
LAALTVAGLRGRAEGVLPAALVKFTAAAVVPYIWFCRPSARRGLLIGAGFAAGAAISSLLMGPGLWQEYLATLGLQKDMALAGHTIIHLLPTAGVDYAVRLALAALLVVASVRWRSPHLAFIATMVALPTLWITRLTLLFALLTLDDDNRLRRLTHRQPVRTSS